MFSRTVAAKYHTYVHFTYPPFSNDGAISICIKFNLHGSSTVGTGSLMCKLLLSMVLTLGVVCHIIDTCCVGNAAIALVAAGDICWLSDNAGSSHMIIPCVQVDYLR